ETWFIRGGSAGAALYTFKQPGVYAYVNHNLIEAFDKGAAGHNKVEGEWNHDLMTQVKAPGPIEGEDGKAAPKAAAPAAANPPAAPAVTSAAKAKPVAANTHPAGAKLYKSACVACHSTGVANAPKLGDRKAWEPLLGKGEAAVMEVAFKGKGAMAPRGGSAADDATLRAAVQYMISKVQ